MCSLIGFLVQNFLICFCFGLNSLLVRLLDSVVCEMLMIRLGILVLFGSCCSICCSICFICVSCCFSGFRFIVCFCCLVNLVSSLIFFDFRLVSFLCLLLISSIYVMNMMISVSNEQKMILVFCGQLLMLLKFRFLMLIFWFMCDFFVVVY